MEKAPVALQPALITLARLKYLIGEQLVTVGPVAPDLIASLSSVAVAQSVMGQARFLYNWQAGESRAADEELAEASTWALETELLSFQAWPTWVHLITVMWMVDQAILVVLAEWIHEDPTLDGQLKKLRQELRQTLVFTSEWVGVFLNETPPIRDLVRELARHLAERLAPLIGSWAPSALPGFHRLWMKQMEGVA